ncbi:PASTA domain-containing protein [Streptomyces sp. NPDC053427]|uniref:PASTA domain-containing protein n=1 Tax=Streptomyces sp. NPDC053427 TaxID=3365701 RepID=UPI0037D5FAD4
MKKTVITAALALSAAVSPAGPAHADTGPGTMPNVKGKGLVAAYQDLHYNTGVHFADGLGRGRHVLWPADWKVCAQQPAPGARMDELKITLTVVKRHEECAGARRSAGSR